ncbi:hypothetical protein LTR95_016272 [Oleoguttula sp. CCFEE 5521]
MRYALAAAALAAGVVAVPYNKRDIVTDVEVVYQTQYVTVTAGEEPATSAPASTAAPATTSATTQAHWGHRSKWPSSWIQPTSTSTSVYVAPSSEPAPVSSEAPSSTYVPPPPPSSTYVAPAPTSTYVAPPPSSTSVYVAPTTSAYSSPAAASAYSATPTDYAGKVVLHHNLHRANHSAPALEWSQSLADTASKIAQSCVYAHNVDMDNGGYGQNIAAGVKGDDVTSVITDLFYNGEVGYYNNLYGQSQPDMTNFHLWGHFSQIVWKGTTSVGCATQDCTGKKWVDGDGNDLTAQHISPYFTVCNYKSPGNYANEYADNVGVSLKQASIGPSYGL